MSTPASSAAFSASLRVAVSDADLPSVTRTMIRRCAGAVCRSDAAILMAPYSAVPDWPPVPSWLIAVAISVLSGDSRAAG